MRGLQRRSFRPGTVVVDVFNSNSFRESMSRKLAGRVTMWP